MFEAERSCTGHDAHLNNSTQTQQLPSGIANSTCATGLAAAYTVVVLSIVLEELVFGIPSSAWHLIGLASICLAVRAPVHTHIPTLTLHVLAIEAKAKRTFSSDTTPEMEGDAGPGAAAAGLG